VRADGDEVESLLAMTKITVVLAVCRDQEEFVSDTRQSRDLYPAQMQGVVLHATSVFSSTAPAVVCELRRDRYYSMYRTCGRQGECCFR
jgi:3-oxoacyl-[acyl-carrier-protein] synthase III